MDTPSRILACASSNQISISFLSTLLSKKISSDSPFVPWSIVNKYYSADVHFFLVDSQKVSGAQLQGVPAVLFIWSKDQQTWRTDVMKLSQTIQQHGLDPQVSLAVRTRAHKDDAPNSDDEDDAEIDDYLASLGFEYVDQEASSRDAIPGQPRVIDALSTIMWPNMNTGTRNPSIDLLRRDIDPQEEDEDDIDNFSGSSSAMSRQREVDELIHWLESEETSASSRDPWKIGALSSAEIATSPTDLHAGPTESGFDDDFSDFVTVTAPPEGSMPSYDYGFASEVYTSLGSVSDVGATKAGPPDRGPFEHVEEDDAETFPTEAEIRETSNQIFGWPPSSFSASSSDDFHTRGLDAPGPVTTPHADSYSFEPRVFKNVAVASSSKDPDNSDPDEAEANFDFSHVLSTLEGMKAQIAEMTDEGEKRKMAARIALGVVYGAGSNTDQVPLR